MSNALERNKEIARMFPEEVATKGNLDAIDEFVGDELVQHGIFGEMTSGHEEIRAQVEMIRSAFPDFEATVEDVIAEGDLVAMRVHLTGTHEGEFMGIAPTGNSFDVQNLVLSRIEDGKLVERWVHPDVLAMFRQLGVERVPSEPPTP